MYWWVVVMVVAKKCQWKGKKGGKDFVQKHKQKRKVANALFIHYEVCKSCGCLWLWMDQLFSMGLEAPSWANEYYVHFLLFFIPYTAKFCYLLINFSFECKRMFVCPIRQWCWWVRTRGQWWWWWWCGGSMSSRLSCIFMCESSSEFSLRYTR